MYTELQTFIDICRLCIVIVLVSIRVARPLVLVLVLFVVPVLIIYHLVPVFLYKRAKNEYQPVRNLRPP